MQPGTSGDINFERRAKHNWAPQFYPQLFPWGHFPVPWGAATGWWNPNRKWQSKQAEESALVTFFHPSQPLVGKLKELKELFSTIQCWTDRDGIWSLKELDRPWSTPGLFVWIPEGQNLGIRACPTITGQIPGKGQTWNRPALMKTKINPDTLPNYQNKTTLLGRR